jgi:hypothetical protein
MLIVIRAQSTHRIEEQRQSRLAGHTRRQEMVVKDVTNEKINVNR